MPRTHFRRSNVLSYCLDAVPRPLSAATVAALFSRYTPRQNSRKRVGEGSIIFWPLSPIMALLGHGTQQRNAGTI